MPRRNSNPHFQQTSGHLDWQAVDWQAVDWQAVDWQAVDSLFGVTATSWPGPPHSRDFQITLNDAPVSVGLLWTSDQLVAETSTCHHTTLTADIHAPGGIQTHNLSRRAAADPRLRPRRCLDWQAVDYLT
jgi:hypothetical protein